MDDINIYQVYYQEDQKAQLFSDTIPYFNNKLTTIFENQVLLDLYRQGKIHGAYFGLLSWKTKQKNRLSFNSIKPRLDPKYNFISVTYDRHDVLGYAEKCHPGFTMIFKKLLQYIEVDQDIRPLAGIYQNGVITKPSVYVDYIEKFLLPALEFFEQCEAEIKEKLFSDTRYQRVNQSISLETFGTNFYPFHTFLLERLWSVYFHLNREKKFNYNFLVDRWIRTYSPNKVEPKGQLFKFNLELN